jgi:hypothetical protein
LSTGEYFELRDEISETTASQLCVDILGGASELQALGFDQGIRFDNKCRLAPLPPELLLASRLSSLTHLFIENAFVNADSLIEALSRCQNSLVCTSMCYVALSMNDEGWVKVVRTLLAMPGLVYVQLLLIPAASVEPDRLLNLVENFTWPKVNNNEVIDCSNNVLRTMNACCARPTTQPALCRSGDD